MQEEALPLLPALTYSRGTIGSPEKPSVLRAFPVPREQRPKGATSRTSPKSVRVREKTSRASLPVTDPSAPGIHPLRRKHIIPGEHTSKVGTSPGKTAPHPAGFPQCKESAKIIVL